MPNIFIPTKIKIGYQARTDTSTGRLAYVTYYDDLGVLRKEKSWEDWRSKDIEPEEVENKLMAGFVINKGVRRYGYFGSGRSIIRIFHPMGFDFEVSVDNLIAMLLHCDVSNSTIQEECILAWDNTTLVLLPKNSEEYQNAVKFTEKKNKKFSAKDLIVGATYSQKKNSDTVVYLGFFPYYDSDYTYGTVNHKMRGKKHVFVGSAGDILRLEPTTHIAECIDSSVSARYDQAVIAFNNSKHSQSGTYIFAKLGEDGAKFYHTQRAILQTADGKFMSIQLQRDRQSDCLQYQELYGAADVDFATGAISYQNSSGQYKYHQPKAVNLPGITSTVDSTGHRYLDGDACQRMFDVYKIGRIALKLSNTGEII